MIIESSFESFLSNEFQVDYDPNGFNLYNSEGLKNNTSLVSLNTESKSITIELFYTRDVFKLNKLLQKGSHLELKYTHLNDVLFNGTITISNLSFNLSRENNHQPTITLYCIYE